MVDRPLGDFFSRFSTSMDISRPTVEDVPAVEGADENAGDYHLRVLTPEDLQSHKLFPRLRALYTSPVQRRRDVFHGGNSWMSLPDLHGQVWVPSVICCLGVMSFVEVNPVAAYLGINHLCGVIFNCD